MKTVDLSSLISLDKSSLIRQALFSLLTVDDVEVPFQPDLPGDIKTAFKVLEGFSKKVEIKDTRATISGVAKKPEAPIDCENSGTVMHLLMGICTLKGWDVECTGDRSLRSRDHSSFVRAAELYKNEVVRAKLEKQSAQLKSFHLLAMLKNGGELTYKWKTRSNTEVLLKKMGAKITDNGTVLCVSPAKTLKGYSVTAEKDPSSAFIAVCAGLIAGRTVKIENILNEELRLEPFKVLKDAGYAVNILRYGKKVSVETSEKTVVGKNIKVEGSQVAYLIDEIPFLAYMVVRKGLSFSCKDAKWLRNKESDRISLTVKLLSGFFKVCESDDGFKVAPEMPQTKESLFHSDDHRMEMLAALISLDQNTGFEPNACYYISFPGFGKVVEILKK